jgi:multiple sugar transport system permease protein
MDAIKNDRGVAKFLLPSLCGMLVFYFIPFCISLYYALIDNMSNRQFVGIKHFGITLQNPIFRQGLTNTALYMLICIPLNMALALSLACAIRGMRRGKGLAILTLLLPVMIPSGATAVFWSFLFDLDGLVNKVRLAFGLPTVNWPDSPVILLFLVIVYLWKYVGMSVMLFLAGLYQIPAAYYEIALVAGAKPHQVFRHVTLALLKPVTYVVLLFSVVNSFKVFREIYLLYGNYPGRYVYMLQHYMNNQFFSVNMQKLTSANYIFIFMLCMILLALFQAQRRRTDTFVDVQPGRDVLRTNKPLVTGYVIIAILLAVLPLSFLFVNSLVNINQYVHLITDNLVYLRRYWNSIFLVFPILLGQCAVSPLAAYALERMKWRHKEKLYIIYIITMLMPLQVLLVPHFITADILGLTNTWWAIIIPALCNPLGVFLIRQSLKAFPQGCIEAAQLDGASEWSIFRNVVLPSLKPIIGILASFTFAEYWNIVEQSVVMIQSPYAEPLSVSLSRVSDNGADFAASFLYIIPALIVFFQVSRSVLRWVQGDL